MIEFTCLNCGKKIKRIDKRNDKYCSNKCQLEHQFQIDYKNRTKLCPDCKEIKSFEELIKRLTETLPKGITWEYYSNNTNKFDIDHIIPQSIYNFDSVESKEFLKCWDLRNLRILSKSENISKSNKLITELIKENKLENLLPEGLNIC